jgi:tetratricopeptide (TPR) repeat protein
MKTVFGLGVALSIWFAAAAEPAKTVTVKPKKEAAAGEAAKDPVQAEYERLVSNDEKALQEIEKWVEEFQAFERQGAGGSKAALSARVEARLEEVQRAYDEFLARQPKHVDARLAYGSFLNEIGNEQEAIVQWEKARELDPKNPTPWNNLANIFGHIGPVKKAFQYYEKAIELDPNEVVYVHNLATTVYLFRKDAAETYRIDEQQIFDKALELYRRAMKLDPDNLVLATDYAQSYYGIKPTRVDDAVAAWKHALTLARSDAEREGIYLHLARVQLNNGRFKDAEENLALVKDPEMQEMKKRLQRNLEEKRANAQAQPAAKEEKPEEKPAEVKQSEK